MNRISKRLALPLISTCLTLACNHSNDLESRFAGDWMFNALVLEDGCSSYPGVGPLTGHIRIIQTGDSLVLEQQGCCLAGTIGTGTADRIAFTATSIPPSLPAPTVLTSSMRSTMGSSGETS